MNGTIYLIRNSVNGKEYIGQTIQDVEVRFKQHLKLSQSNKKQLIYKAIEKYGKENFSYIVLETNITTYEKLNELEEKYILQYNSLSPNGYNLCPGGQKWRRKPKQKVDDNDEIDIIEKYESGMSTRSIAEIYNVDKKDISNILKKHSITIRSKTCNLPNRTSKITKEIMEDLYINKKMKVSDIALLLNTSVRSVNRAKKRYNMKRI